MTKRVYLAGPEVFLPNVIEVGRRKVEICARHGLEGVFPMDPAGASGTNPHPASSEIFARCLSDMLSSDAIIANLTPFRGPGADGGTVFELGFMAGRGVPRFGYSNVSDTYSSRAMSFAGDFEADRLVDLEGMTIENFGLADNLMIAHGLDFLAVPDPTDGNRWIDATPWEDMTQFERCVRRLATMLGDEIGQGVASSPRNAAEGTPSSPSSRTDPGPYGSGLDEFIADEGILDECGQAAIEKLAEPSGDEAGFGYAPIPDQPERALARAHAYLRTHDVDFRETAVLLSHYVSLEFEDFARRLRNPCAVHINMLRGTIAVPPIRSMLHAHSPAAVRVWTTVQRIGEAVARGSTAEIPDLVAELAQAAAEVGEA